MNELGSFLHQNRLSLLDEGLPVADKLRYIHELINIDYPYVSRISVALYDAKTDLLKSYIHSCHGPTSLGHYQARLSDSYSLQMSVAMNQPRVINDTSRISGINSKHAQRLAEHGYRASYTLPLYYRNNFIGFLFFNTKRKGAFRGQLLHTLDIYGRMISLTVGQELADIQTLLSALHTIKEIGHHRDNETGAHLERMSRYAHLIARTLAPKRQLDDDFIEQIFLFAPLHDIGKIAIPDRVLLKKGCFTEEESRLMQSHSTKGWQIISSMLNNFGIEQQHSSETLRNIVELHHERLDGSGYPHQLRGGEIPLEARIVAVADVFDALTSERPYKNAWSNEKALSELNRQAGIKYDEECVAALVSQRSTITEIQALFQEATIPVTH